MPIALECPTCGAQLPEDAAYRTVTCRFCKASAKPAPRTPPPAAAPPQVVERVVVVQKDGTTSLPCPSCKAALVAAETQEGTTIHGCAGCGGVWLDNDSTKRAVARLEQDALSLADRASRHARPQASAQGPRPCPLCSAEMARVHAATVEIDVCAAHGTWFDAGELRVVAEAAERLRGKKRARAQDLFEAQAIAQRLATERGFAEIMAELIRR